MIHDIAVHGRQHELEARGNSLSGEVGKKELPLSVGRTRIPEHGRKRIPTRIPHREVHLVYAI